MTTPYPTVDEFTELLTALPLEELVTQHLFGGTPFVFRDSPSDFEKLRKHLASWLSVRNDNVFVVGSARIGFSLSPDNFPRSFDDRSDIDVVVIDDKLFDRAWDTLIRWHYPRRTSRLPEPEWKWLQTRRHDVFVGWFRPADIPYAGLSYPDALKPIRDLSTRWFNAFQSLSKHREFSRRDISGRLYRSQAHAALYHVDGLRILKERLGA